MELILEVIALDAADARAARDGGADRIELVSDMRRQGLTPELATFEAVRAAVDLPVRVMLRNQDGYALEHVSALRAAATALRRAGADEFVLGFLDARGRIDLAAMEAVLSVIDGCRWTFHRALDHVTDRAAAWHTLAGLPGLDQVLTAGSPDGVSAGLPTLQAEATRLTALQSRAAMAPGDRAPAGTGALQTPNDGGGARDDRSPGGPRGTQNADGPRDDRNPDGPRGIQSADGPRGAQNPDRPRGIQNAGGPRDDRNPDRPRDDRNPDGPRGAQRLGDPRGDRNPGSLRGDHGAGGSGGDRAPNGPVATRLPGILAGGGLRREHVGPLLAAGVRAFHSGSAVRAGNRWDAPVDPTLVAEWRAHLQP